MCNGRIAVFHNAALMKCNSEQMSKQQRHQDSTAIEQADTEHTAISSTFRRRVRSKSRSMLANADRAAH